MLVSARRKRRARYGGGSVLMLKCIRHLRDDRSMMKSDRTVRARERDKV